MTIITLKTSVLRRVLSNAILFACKDDTLPVICSVRFEFEDEYLVVVATDRYVLSYETAGTVKTEDREPFSLSVQDAKQVMRLLPKDQGETVVEYSPHGGTIRVTSDNGLEATFRAVSGDFPRYTLLVAGFKPAEKTEVAFNPIFLARFAKVDAGERTYGAPAYPVVFEMSEGLKPVRVTIGRTFKAIIVPVRTNQDV